MALNRVIICGVVEEEPDFCVNDVYDNALEVKLLVNRYEIGKQEHISFLIFNEELMERALKEIHKGDYLQMNEGRIITRHYERIVPIVCPHCQHVEYRKQNSERTDIECFDFSVMSGVDFSSAPGLNRVFVLGNVCTPLKVQPATVNHGEYTKYKIGINRKMGKNTQKGNDNSEETKFADFPFVVSFNREAVIAKERVKPTALLAVEGSVQQRSIIQNYPVFCPNCQEESVARIGSMVREIISVHTQFLTLGDKEDYPQQPELKQNLLRIDEEDE